MAVIHRNLMCASDSLHNAIDIIRYVQCSHSEVSLCYNCSTWTLIDSETTYKWQKPQRNNYISAHNLVVMR